MSNSVATSQPSSGWRRMSDKLNIKKTKIHDCPTDSIKISEITILNHEVEAITDFRVHQGAEQYLVSWRSDLVTDLKASWECEKVIEAVCQDALVKFWMKTVLAEGNEEINTNLDNSHNLTSIFKKKLWNWTSQPTNKEATNNLLTPSKKRPRQYISDDELDSSICEIENKQPKLSSDSVGEKSKENFDIRSSIQITPDNNDFFGFSNISKTNEMYDLIETPQCEIGEIITSKKNVDDESSSTSYLVAWLYIANETPNSLGLSDKHLQEHCERLSTEVTREKCLLYRKKCHKASIKVVPCARKSYSPRSDSDQSELSTVPPSESGTVDSVEYRMLTENFNDVECQTSIELDPYACLYCQSRKGEDKRLSSLRQRKSIKEEEKAVQKNQKSKKSNEVAKMEVADDGANEEEDDDDMVSIEYEVEKILNFRQVEGTKVDEYYIRWKGFTSFYDTWEPYDNLSTCDKALILFYVDRVAERKNVEEEIKNGGGKKLVKPLLPPIPEILMEKLSRTAPVSNEEIEVKILMYFIRSYTFFRDYYNKNVYKFITITDGL